MSKPVQPINPTEWVAAIFDCKTAEQGGILKRLIKSVQKRASRRHLIGEVQRLGFQMYQSETHYIIDCSKNSQLEKIC